MNNENEGISEWKQIKEEFYDYLAQALDEREERKQQKKRDSYIVSTSEDLDRLLSSSLSFEEKRQLLISEKERASKILDEINDAENKFDNSRAVIIAMKKAYNKILKDFKAQLPITLGTLTFSGVSIGELSKFLENNTLSDLEPNQVIAAFLGTVLLPLLGTFSTYYSINDLRNLSKYRKEINNYERRLKK